jgi:putative ABC transport system permease protein
VTAFDLPILAAAIMLINYLRVAWRALRKRVGPTVINVVGLAVGLAACLLIGLWVERELSYDDFHPEADRVYRLAAEEWQPDDEIRSAMLPPALRAALLRDAPEVETMTRLRPFFESQVIRQDNRAITADDYVWRADSTFFEVFGGFDLLHGDRATALAGTDGMVMTASTADRLFGRTNVVGEVVQTGSVTRRVTGVIMDIPQTSHLQFDALVPMGTIDPRAQGNWGAWQFFTYAKLKENTSLEAFTASLDRIAERYVISDVQEEANLGPDEYNYTLFTEPLTGLHLHSEFSYLDSGSITTVYTFSAIGLFILLLGCINFMNLATARAAERATEVGVRKALGAGRSQLMGQFFGEALLTTGAATVLALGLVSGALPTFNQIAGTSFGFGTFLRPSVLLGLLALVVIVGGVSGSYPAVALSRFAPAESLKAGKGNTSSRQGRRLRQGLVVFQFAISVAMIVGTLGAKQQFDYVQSKRLGLDTERVVAIEEAGNLGSGQATLVDRLRQTPGVAAASAGEGMFGTTSISSFWPADSTSEANEVLNYFRVGHGFTETMGIEVIQGRPFDPARPSDSMAVLLNESAVAAYGFDDPTQRRLTPGDSATVYDVIGVVDDFHYESMREQVGPAIFLMGGSAAQQERPRNVYARLEADRPGETLDRVRAVWDEVAGVSVPFQYSFLDQTYDEMHRDVQRASTLFGLFAGLAVVIACLGLFGLATYTVQRRRKEIGIRKALGATASQVVGLLSKQFLMLVGVGAAIALPLAYWGMEQWLEGFAYRTTVGPNVLVGSVTLAGAVAFATISYHALQAARLDPATTLTDE